MAKRITITDEQIRGLRAACGGLVAATHVRALCDLALADTEAARIVLALKPYKRKVARRRCADLLLELTSKEHA